MQNTIPNPFENNTTAIIFNDPLYGNETSPATHSATQNFQPTRMVLQQNNILLMCKNISESIKAFKKNAKKQLRQADELKDQLAQLEQLLNTQQPSPTLRCASRNRNHRIHPY